LLAKWVYDVLSVRVQEEVDRIREGDSPQRHREHRGGTEIRK
jgi:hypothetical protein